MEHNSMEHNSMEYNNMEHNNMEHNITKKYNFGPHNPFFLGSLEEWDELKNKIAWWHEDSLKYPFVSVLCPHCGTKNTHDITYDGGDGPRDCDLTVDQTGKIIKYECPGYYICRWLDIYDPDT